MLNRLTSHVHKNRHSILWLSVYVLIGITTLYIAYAMQFDSLETESTMFYLKLILKMSLHMFGGVMIGHSCYTMFSIIKHRKKVRKEIHDLTKTIENQDVNDPR